MTSWLVSEYTWYLKWVYPLDLDLSDLMLAISAWIVSKSNWIKSCLTVFKEYWELSSFLVCGENLPHIRGHESNLCSLLSGNIGHTLWFLLCIQFLKQFLRNVSYFPGRSLITRCNKVNLRTNLFLNLRKLKLKGWVSDEKHFLLFQKTQNLFQAHTSGVWQPPVA